MTAPGLSPAEVAIVERFEVAEPAPESWRPPALEWVTCADLLTSCTHEGPHVPVGLDGRPVTARPVGDGDGQDGLREVIAAKFDELEVYCRGVGNDDLADLVLTLPELTALRAKAAAADRVRELVRFWDVAETPAAVMETEIRRALDGDGQPTTEESR